MEGDDDHNYVIITSIMQADFNNVVIIIIGMALLVVHREKFKKRMNLVFNTRVKLTNVMKNIPNARGQPNQCYEYYRFTHFSLAVKCKWYLPL